MTLQVSLHKDAHLVHLLDLAVDGEVDLADGALHVLRTPVKVRIGAATIHVQDDVAHKLVRAENGQKRA